jgi:hypothetical protein
MLVFNQETLLIGPEENEIKGGSFAQLKNSGRKNSSSGLAAKSFAQGLLTNS